MMRQGRELQSPPSLMRMTPQIYIVLNVRKPANTNVGEDLNSALSRTLEPCSARRDASRNLWSEWVDQLQWLRY